MSWWRRFLARRLPIYDEQALAALRHASDEEKEEWHRQRLQRMRLNPDLVADVEGATDEENEAALAAEIRKMKRRNPREWELLLASLAVENQNQLRDIERRYGI